MSNEPGERRRRRELEREREHAAEQQAGSGPSPTSPPTTPPAAAPAPVLSRRELRDRERARAAAELAATVSADETARPMTRPEAPKSSPTARQAPALEPWTPSQPVAVAPKPVTPKPVTPKSVTPTPVTTTPVTTTPVTTTPVMTTPVTTTPVRRSYSKEAGPTEGGAQAGVPEALAPAAEPPRQSRRSMRPQAAPTETARTPVVHPPATTGTIRMVVPEATVAVDRPARSDGLSTPGRGYPPVAPRRSALSPLVTSAGRVPAPPRQSPADTSASATPPSATPPSATPSSVSGGDFAWPTNAAPVSPVGWAPVPDRTTTPDRAVVPDHSPVPDQIAAPDHGPAGARPVGSAQPDEAAVVVAPPTRRPATPARPGGAPLAPRWGHVPSGSFDAITRPPDDEEDPPAPVRLTAEAKDAGPVRRSAAYTWLQMLALAALAFVLGFLVWLLIKGSNEPGATGASAPVPTTSSSGASWPHLGDL